MHSAKAASILILLTIIAPPIFALPHKAQTYNPPTQGDASESSASAAKAPANKGKSQRFKHSPARRSSPDELSLPAVSLVSGTPEYLSGEANVTVKGNENPIIRLGLATSGVTLVEFPAADRFFAIHPGNSEMVTIDESPTKQNDHFFVFRAGSNFVSPPAASSSTGPAASIIAQMRSGMVVTFLIYPVRELSQMAHRVVILYDRVAVVAARRAAGLAVNLEENNPQQIERSIRIGGQSDSSSAQIEPLGAENAAEVRARAVEPHRISGQRADIASSTLSRPAHRASLLNQAPTLSPTLILARRRARP